MRQLIPVPASMRCPAQASQASAYSPDPFQPLPPAPCPHAVATLSGENQTAALLQWPAIRDTFLINQRGKVGRQEALQMRYPSDGEFIHRRSFSCSLQWRAPHINETCCKRPQLADFLSAGAACIAVTQQLHRPLQHALGAVQRRLLAAAGLLGCLQWQRRARTCFTAAVTLLRLRGTSKHQVGPTGHFSELARGATSSTGRRLRCHFSELLSLPALQAA